MSSTDIPLFPVATPRAGGGFTGRDLWRQWFKYWGTILGSTVTVGALTLYGVAMQAPQYQASAKVWVKTEQQGTPSFLSGVSAYREGQVIDPVNRKIETEMQLLLARPNVEAVVRKLGMTRRDLPGNALSAVLGSPRAASPEAELQATVDVFLKTVKVEAARSKTADTASNLLDISLTTTRAELAPQALHALVAQYQQYGTAQTRQQGQASYALIRDKMMAAQADLDQLDQRLLKLMVAQGKRSDVPVQGTPPVPVEVVVEPGEGLRMDTMLGSARAGGTSAVGLLKQQTVTLQSRVEELRQQYTDEAEPVRNARRQLAQAEARLSRSVQAGAELEAQMRQLERSRALAQDRYIELRRKLDQIELYLASSPDETTSRVLTERAQVPDKPERKKLIVLGVLGPLLGLALGLLLAGLREYFDHRLQSAEDVERYLGLEALAIIPDHGKERP
ncbi:hypothetical protein EYS42_15825 [Aquabacterium lacunae]|uniref:Lipopolysaccharide biosynthesis protein n=1 Tax=Aquabacterium lacunae TaxID=2528630 RepID=A0A4Q9GUV1_9BURK|nr:hypothetical protein [Aquabacterium lacunae]TBO27903.1 hypothetical protein EYS42_15825 [Aquabacterium lacunae]